MKIKSARLEAGQEFQFSFPFIRDEYSEMDGDGVSTSKTWRPGVRMVRWSQFEDHAVADGIGQQIITVVSTHRPEGWPERVFYMRKWRDPSGKVFGKRALYVRSAAKFTELVRGYRYAFELSSVVTK